MIKKKLVSAQFWMALMVTAALCVLAYQEKVTSEAFVGIATLISKSYFDRVRRNISEKSDDN